MKDYYGIPFSHMNKRQWVFLALYVSWFPLGFIWSVEFMAGYDMIPGGNMIVTIFPYDCMSDMAYGMNENLSGVSETFDFTGALLNLFLEEDKCGIREEAIMTFSNGISYPIP